MAVLWVTAAQARALGGWVHDAVGGSDPVCLEVDDAGRLRARQDGEWTAWLPDGLEVGPDA